MHQRGLSEVFANPGEPAEEGAGGAGVAEGDAFDESDGQGGLIGPEARGEFVEEGLISGGVGIEDFDVIEREALGEAAGECLADFVDFADARER